jgi:hypothetical protein
MVASGGRYFLHTPVKGYFEHGFHTFHPDLITEAFTINRFEIEYLKYSSGWGAPLEHPGDADDALIWIVGRKTAPLGDFRIRSRSPGQRSTARLPAEEQTAPGLTRRGRRLTDSSVRSHHRAR